MLRKIIKNISKYLLICNVFFMYFIYTYEDTWEVRSSYSYSLNNIEDKSKRIDLCNHINENLENNLGLESSSIQASLVDYEKLVFSYSVKGSDVTSCLQYFFKNSINSYLNKNDFKLEDNNLYLLGGDSYVGVGKAVRIVMLLNMATIVVYLSISDYNKIVFRLKRWKRGC